MEPRRWPRREALQLLGLAGGGLVTACGGSPQTPPEPGTEAEAAASGDFHSARDLQRNGGPGYAQTVTRFVPILREAGVGDDQIRTLTVDNPLRFLAFVP